MFSLFRVNPILSLRARARGAPPSERAAAAACWPLSPIPFCELRFAATAASGRPLQRSAAMERSGGDGEVGGAGN